MEGQSIVTDSQAKSQQPVSAKLPADDEIDLLDYLHVIWRYRWMILVLCIMAMSLTVVLTLCEPRQYQSTVTIVPPLDILQKESGGPLGTLNNSLLRQVMDTTAGSIAKMYGERPANPSFHRGCSAILCPPIKEVQYGTEDIEVVESPGPVLAEAGSAMAEIGCDAESVLPRTRPLDRGVSLVAAEADAPASRGWIPRKSCPPRPYRPSPRSGSPRASAAAAYAYEIILPNRTQVRLRQNFDAEAVAALVSLLGAPC